MELVPQARELIHHARETGRTDGADLAERVLDEILERPEHRWFIAGAEEQSALIRQQMEQRYGHGGS